MMKSGSYYTNPKRKNPIKPFNLLFKYNFTIQLPKHAIIIVVLFPMIFIWFSYISRCKVPDVCLASRRWQCCSSNHGGHWYAPWLLWQRVKAIAIRSNLNESFEPKILTILPSLTRTHCKDLQISSNKKHFFNIHTSSYLQQHIRTIVKHADTEHIMLTAQTS